MIEDFFGSATLFDVVVILVALGMFVGGWLQGAIRGLLSIAAFLAAFVIAGGLRSPLGEFLARNWTYYDPGFNFMLALLGLWVALAITLQIGVAIFYHRVVLHRRLVVVDEIVGGLLGTAQVFLVVALLVAVFDSYYATLGRGIEPRDIGWASAIDDLFRHSAVAAGLRDGFLPGLLSLLAPLLPADIVARTP
jgi:uncharacterized membrane protein required for colicin V production